MTKKINAVPVMAVERSFELFQSKKNKIPIHNKTP